MLWITASEGLTSTTFNLANVADVQAAFVGKLLLSHLSLYSQLFNGLTELPCHVDRRLHCCAANDLFDSLQKIRHLHAKRLRQRLQ
jgi:hypothetical protein